MFIHHLPAFIPKILPRLTWECPNEIDSNAVYFTFDDGPTPEITEFVLDCLTTFSAKASFFCIGKNMLENTELTNSLVTNGHKIGNHTMNHLNAWKNNHKEYLQDYLKCNQVFTDLNIKSIGFRPPYGRINSLIYNTIAPIEPVYMWSFLSGDYNADLRTNEIIKSAKKAIKPGCILVFHDSVKAFPRLKIVLPELLEFCLQQNYSLKSL
jgi:peptidoglycan/xylan/chitin deacetylase (PgdA/CDA1 family)